MKLQMKTVARVLGMLPVTLFVQATALADDQIAPTMATQNSSDVSDTRYGLFDGLDHRSSYGQDVFPEPFLVDDSDLETREFRLDWLHTASGSDHTDIIHPELEWGFGNLTLELETPYERDVENGEVTKGFDNVDVGARYPLYEAVSPRGFADTTFGAAIELGIPTTSDVSQNTELVPKIFNDTKLGNFTVQSIAGYSMLYGPGDDGGLNTFEYGFTFGCNISHQMLPFPDVEKLIPVFELTGETELNHEHQTSLTGDVGLRANLKTIWGIQPRPGVVFVFPLNNNSRNEQHWGIMTSLVFEF
jgi:hypothetical protein